MKLIDNDNIKCEKCYYHYSWQDEGYPRDHFCRRYPTSVETTPDYSCGEFVKEPSNTSALFRNADGTWCIPAS